MGLAAVAEQDPLASVGETWPTFARNPRLACRNAARRILLLEDLVRWRARYREALLRWRDGEHGVEFPYGAYWLPHFFGAETSRAPPSP